MKFRMADVNFQYDIESNPCRKELLKDYEDFLTEDPPDITISTQQIESCRRILDKADFRMTEYMRESGALELALIDSLRPYNTVIIHSAAVVLDGMAYAFAGPSGIGKSTQCALWLQHFKNRAYILNGDKPFYHQDGNRWTVYGTPWKGKEQIGVNASAPLAAICFLRQATVNKIRKLNSDEVADKLLRQTYMPVNRKDMELHLKQIDELIRTIPCFEMECTISDEAVQISYQAMHTKGTNRKGFI